MEDESHLLLFCPAYRFQRQIFLGPITNQNYNFKNLSVTEKLEFLMRKMDGVLCTFIANSMDIREFIINKPNQKWLCRAGEGCD